MKKTLITLGSIGAIATITTPVMISIYNSNSDNAQKENKIAAAVNNKSTKTAPKKVTTAQEDINKMLGLIGSFAKIKTLNDKNDKVVKENLSKIVVKFIKSGLNGMTFPDLDTLLTTFNASDKIKGIIYSLFTKEDPKDAKQKVINLKLVNMLLNTGLSSLKDKENANELKTIETLITSLIPASFPIDNALINKLMLTGFATSDEFVNDVSVILSKIPQVKSILDTKALGEVPKELIKGLLSSIYKTFSGLLKHGMLNISIDDLKQIINWDGLLDDKTLSSTVNILQLPSANLPDNIGDIIKKVVVTDGKIDVLHTARNFLAKQEIVPQSWTTFDKVMKVWDSLKTLNKSHSIDPLLAAIPTILQKGVSHLTSEQVNQLANVVDFAVDYDVEITKSSSDKLKKAIIKSFEGKFADAQNTKTVSLSALKKAKNIKEFANIAENILAFNTKEIHKVTFALPSIKLNSYFNPIQTLLDYKKTLTNKLDELYLSKDTAQKPVSDGSTTSINNAKTLEDAKKIVDKLNKAGLYTKSTFGIPNYIDGKLTIVDTTLPAFDNMTSDQEIKNKKSFKTFFEKMSLKTLFTDKALKTRVSFDSIINAKTLRDMMDEAAKLPYFNREKLVLVTYTDDGSKFGLDIKKIIKDNPLAPVEHKESEVIDQFKKDSVLALANLYTDKKHLIPVDVTNIENAKTIAEIKAAFAALTTSGVLYQALYDKSGNVVKDIPSVSIPSKYSLMGTLDKAFLNRTTHKSTGNAINTIYQVLPQLNDFLLNGISKIKGDKTKLDEFVPKTLMPLLQVLLPLFGKTKNLSIDTMAPIIKSQLNPIIEKIAKMD